jgi:hypothetical protein
LRRVRVNLDNRIPFTWLQMLKVNKFYFLSRAVKSSGAPRQIYLNVLAGFILNLIMLLLI